MSFAIKPRFYSTVCVRKEGRFVICDKPAKARWLAGLLLTSDIDLARQARLQAIFQITFNHHGSAGFFIQTDKSDMGIRY